MTPIIVCVATTSPLGVLAVRLSGPAAGGSMKRRLRTFVIIVFAIGVASIVAMYVVP